mmetsp:Transcript_28517/g.45277  ORF Transcript_28517/g.45277 Transcript_28517/m.45277 type:complete len:354 (+) Transcript_28517:3544-4605(+)
MVDPGYPVALPQPYAVESAPSVRIMVSPACVVPVHAKVLDSGFSVPSGGAMYADAKLCCSTGRLLAATPRSKTALVTYGPTSPKRKRLEGSAICFVNSSRTSFAVLGPSCFAPLRRSPGARSPARAVGCSSGKGSEIVINTFTEPCSKPTILMRSIGTPQASAIARLNFVANTASVCRCTTSIVRSSNVSCAVTPLFIGSFALAKLSASKLCIIITVSGLAVVTWWSPSLSGGPSAAPGIANLSLGCTFSSLLFRSSKPTGVNQRSSSSGSSTVASPGERGLSFVRMMPSPAPSLAGTLPDNDVARGPVPQALAGSVVSESMGNSRDRTPCACCLEGNCVLLRACSDSKGGSP